MSNVGKTAKGRILSRLSLILATSAALLCSAHAQNLNDTLARAYTENPSLNAARAALRVTNESVPQALSGYRPKVSGNADIGFQNNSGVPTGGVYTNSNTNPRGFGIQVDQTLWNAGRVGNQVEQAESQVMAARETLRATEQDVLLQAATAYMDVVRDASILKLRQGFVNLMAEQLKATRDRFAVGEVTQTDVAQSQARHSLAISQLRAAEATLTASKANYLRIVRANPGQLTGRTNIESLLPKRIEDAVRIGLVEHPQIRGAAYGVDVAEFAIRVTAASLYPTVSATASFNRRYEPVGYDKLDTAAIVGRVVVPIYDGGENQSRVRQAKEQRGQRRIELDSVRDQIRNLIVANWGQHQATKAQIVAAQAQIEASTVALRGVKDEALVGRRTTLEVLNAQQDLLDARVALVRNEHDRVVAAYTVLGAIGRLDSVSLKLKVATHNPADHYNQVRDLWGGIRTPSGE